MKSRRITLFAGLLTSVSSILLLTTEPCLAITMDYWTGTTSDDWTVNGNWSVGYLNDSNHAAVFGPISNGNTAPFINSAVGYVVGYIEFQAGAPAYNITDSGGTCRLYVGMSGPSAGILVDAGVTNSQTISPTYLFFENPSAYYITNNSTTPGVALNIDASLGGHYASSLSGTWVVNGSNNTNIAGTIFDNNSSVATTEVDKEGTGTLMLSASNTYTGGTEIGGGVLQLGDGVANNGYVAGNVTNNATLVFANPSVQSFSGAISGSGSLTKQSAGVLTLSGTSSYSGGTSINQGTLNVTGALVGGGNVQIAAGATLGGSGIVQGNIIGAVGATITASGNLILGDSTSYTGYNHTGTLSVGSNIVTLNSAAFANLGVLTTLGSGTLAAPNGITVPLGGNLVGSGLVNGKIAAGYGSTINATGNLTLGDSTSPAGFTSNGELYTGANTVTLQSKNQAILGSLTQLGANGNSGTLVAVNGIVLDYGNNLVGQGTVSTPNTLAAASIINGNVDGTGSGLNFTGYVKGAGAFSGQVTFSGSYSIGNSPATVSLQDATFSPSSTLIMEFAGDTPGSQYDQLEISELAALGGTLDVTALNGFSPSAGESFEIFNGPTIGSFSQINLPALSNGLSWNTSNLYSNGEISVVPEPSTIALLAAGAAGLVGFRVWRRRGNGPLRIAAEPTLSSDDETDSQDDAPAILSFRSPSSPAHAARRAA